MHAKKARRPGSHANAPGAGQAIVSIAKGLVRDRDAASSVDLQSGEGLRFRGFSNGAGALGGSKAVGMNKLFGSNGTEGIPPERPGILEGLATRLQEGLRATIVALGQSHAQRLAAIVESSADAILSVDLDGIIATWNRGAEKLLGYTADEVIGKPGTMLIPADRQGEEPGFWGGSDAVSGSRTTKLNDCARTEAWLRCH
jgi:PAS domain-containing protein